MRNHDVFVYRKTNDLNEILKYKANGSTRTDYGTIVGLLFKYFTKLKLSVRYKDAPQSFLSYIIALIEEKKLVSDPQISLVIEDIFKLYLSYNDRRANPNQYTGTEYTGFISSFNNTLAVMRDVQGGEPKYPINVDPKTFELAKEVKLYNSTVEFYFLLTNFGIDQLVTFIKLLQQKAGFTTQG